jgi:hypothetical protein
MPNKCEFLDNLCKGAGVFIGLLLAGAGLGWLIGLSVAPGIIQGVITAILAMVVTAASLLAGVQSKKDKDDASPQSSLVRPWPVAGVALGLAIGATLGVYFRSHNTFGKDLKAQVDDWVAAGVSREYAARRLFDEHASSASDKSRPDPSLGALFKVDLDEQLQLKAAGKDRIREVMRSVKDVHVKRFADACDNPVCLKAAVKELICPDD